MARVVKITRASGKIYNIHGVPSHFYCSANFRHLVCLVLVLRFVFSDILDS